MLVLAACCIFIGAAPWAISPVLGEGIASWSFAMIDRESAGAALAPLQWAGAIALALVVLATALALWLRYRFAVSPFDRTATWGCGFLAPTPRIQYTSSSFAQMLADLFGWALRPRVQWPGKLALFPGPENFRSESTDPILERGVIPGLQAGARLIARFRIFQQGSVQLYLLYIFVALIALLVWRY